MGKAFELHLQLGKADVQARIHQLNDYLKARLTEHARVQLVTPRSRELSSASPSSASRAANATPSPATCWSAR